MDKIPWRDNVEGWEDKVGITQLTVTLFYTVTLFCSSPDYTYLFMSSLAQLLHILLQNFLVAFKCLIFKCGWWFLSWSLLIENVQKAFCFSLPLSLWGSANDSALLGPLSVPLFCLPVFPTTTLLSLPDSAALKQVVSESPVLRIRRRSWAPGPWSAAHLSWCPLLSLILSLSHLQVSTFSCWSQSSFLYF